MFCLKHSLSDYEIQRQTPVDGDETSNTVVHHHSVDADTVGRRASKTKDCSKQGTGSSTSNKCGFDHVFLALRWLTDYCDFILEFMQARSSQTSKDKHSKREATKGEYAKEEIAQRQ